MSNKITEISEQIKALKDITFGEIFTQQLKASKIPFPEKFEHYIEQLIENAQFTQNSKLEVLSADKQSDGWHIDLMGQPFSYVELDDQHYNFPANGRTNIVVPLKENEPFFVAKYTWLPYDESFEANYTKPQNDQYFNSIISSVSFPEKQDKGTIEVGYLIYNNDKDQLLFIDNNIYVRGSLENNYSIDKLLPDFTFTVGNKEFTSDSSGTITITTKEAFEIINAYNEQKDVLSVTGKYNGVLKDHIVKERDFVFQSFPNFLELDAFKPSDSSNSTYYNRTNVPLEVEYLGETSTIPVDGSKELNTTFNTVEKLKTIKANATDKFEIKNTFNYPWNKEFTIDSLSVLLDKDYLISQINTNGSLDLTVEVLGNTFNRISDAYYFMNYSYLTPTKEFLETVDKHTTELGATIKDEFSYPWKKFLHVSNLDQFLNKDYLINSAGISYVTNTLDGYYFSKHSNYSYKFNNKELTFDSNNQTVLSYKDVYNYLKNKDNDILPFTIDINSNYYNKNINISGAVNFTALYSNYFSFNSNNTTIENKAGIKKLKAYTTNPEEGIVYTLPEEETFSYYNLLPTELKFKNKFNNGNDIYFIIADDDCTNSIFLNRNIFRINDSEYTIKNNFDNYFVENNQDFKLYNQNNFVLPSDMKQFLTDHYKIIAPNSGNEYDISFDNDNKLVIDNKIKNELFFNNNLIVSLEHTNDSNDEFVKKNNIQINNSDISINNINIIYNDLKSLHKEYDNTKNGFAFEIIDTVISSQSAESAQNLSDIDITKFIDMKVLKFYLPGKDNFVELINSNEKITAINYIKAYNNSGNSYVIISYNTLSESNKIIDKQVTDYTYINGIFYGYNVDNLKDKL
jgi:hypothetical protein|nr:MAG TPA: hypothetical protein [Caudoviricetes sp.]